MKAKIFVVDDHALFREGIVRILNQEKDLQVVGEAGNAADALKQAQPLKPDLLIVDVAMEGMSGIDLTKTLRTRYPDLKILVLSMHKEWLYAERALRAGANGYVMKKENVKKLLTAVRNILAGQTHISDELNQHILQKFSANSRATNSHPVELLSDRELEIFQLIGCGYGTRQIADELNISMKTVETHREHIREKMGLKTTFEMVQQAIHWIHSEELMNRTDSRQSKTAKG